MITPELSDLAPGNGAAQHRTALHAAWPLTGLDKAFAGFLEAAQPAEDTRHGVLAALVSYQFGRGHACLDLDLLERQGVLALGWDPESTAPLPAGLAQGAATLPCIVGPNSPLVLDGTRLYLRRNWRAEQSICAAIAARLAQPCPVPASLEASLELLFPASNADGQTPDWQKIACALAARRRLTLVTGGPGTGKTTTVVRLLAVLQSDAVREGRSLRIALAAPTGKAAARLGESIASAVRMLPDAMRHNIPGKAVTLHKLLRVAGGQADTGAPGLALDLVVVDEASMIDLEMMARLLASVPLSATLILLGDKDQLASVEAGAVMGQLCQGAVCGNYTSETIEWVRRHTGADLAPWAGSGTALAQQTVMLRHSRRFSADSGIGQWAKAVNEGDLPSAQTLWQAAPARSRDGAAPVARLQPEHAGARDFLALVGRGWRDALAEIETLKQGPCSDAQALTILKAFSTFQVLCAVRDGPWGVEAMNRKIASALGFATDGWYAGRPVMVTRNDYNLNLMNGDVGLCLPHARGLRVAFPDGAGGVRWIQPSRLDAIESVFAMTVHKSQGSEFDHVCLVLPDKAVAVLTRELLYTGITRAKTRLSLVVPATGVLWKAVQTRVLRGGGLAPDI